MNFVEDITRTDKRNLSEQITHFNNAHAKNTQHPWVVVIDAGSDHQSIHNDYPSFGSAQIGLKALDYQLGNADIMKRLDDGTLTTEF